MIRKRVLTGLFSTALLVGAGYPAGIAQTAQSMSMTQTTQPAEGTKAPDFTLTADDGRQVSLSDYKGKKAVVLFFYPKDETPGCTKEACAFRDSFADFRKANIEVLGVSVDSVESHQAFKKNQRLNFTLLSDAEKEVSRQYGVLNNERGFAQRVTFIIGKDGMIKKIYPKVSPAEHAAEVLAFTRTLS